MRGWPRVLVVGDVMRDILVIPEGEMRRGSDVNAAISFVPGGSAANQAKWLAHQDVDVTLVARVGQGDGAALAAEIERFGVEAILVEDPDLTTGTLVNLSEPGGERSFFTDRGANRNFAAKDVPDEDLAQTDFLLVSGYLFFAEAGRRAALDLISRAKAAGIKIAIDAASAGYISDVGVSSFLAWTAGADLLFANAEEAALLANEGDAAGQISELRKHFGQVIVKSGAQGAFATGTDGDNAHAPAVASSCEDSTGAGDAFAAGFLSQALRGATLRVCLEAGNRAAALAISKIGGGPPLVQ